MPPARTRALVVLLAGVLACRPSGRGSAAGEGGLTVPVTHAPARPPRDKLSAELRWMFDDAVAAEPRRVLVDLSQQLDLARLSDSLAQTGADRRTRRERVLAALRLVAEQSQTRLRARLEWLKQRGAIEAYKGFVVVNRLLVSAAPAGIRALAEEAEVATITLETASPSAAVMLAGAGAPTGVPPRSWALDAIGVRRAWRRGLDGRGVVVGIIDAGASAAHEQLRGNFRGGARSWYDPSGRSSGPQDFLTGHGTGVLSAAVGRNPGGKTVGVAPGAQWIACVGVPGGRYNNVAFTECADWMLTTGQPDVLINAWQLPTPGCDRSLQRIVDAWRAAEMLPVFAAGNHGPAARSDRSPANYTGLYPGGEAALSVGAVTDAASLFARSSRGPNSCDGSIYPVLVAPGKGVPVAFPLTPSSYIRTDGTSVAAAVAAGTVALLLQRHPDATVLELETALRSGAVDGGPPGPDNGFGYGRLSVPGALAALDRLRMKDAVKAANVAAAHR